MKTKSYGNFLTLVCTALFALCLINSADIAEAGLHYLKLCALRVVPSLFVFSVFAAVICQSNAFYKLCAVPWFGAEAAVLTLGLLGGFPLGANMAVSLYEAGAVSKKQASYLCAFGNMPSLSFMISYTGAVLGSKRTGVLLALLCALASLLAALVLKYAYLNKTERFITPLKTSFPLKSFGKIVADTALSMLTVCGCIVFFGSISRLFPTWLACFFEISGGISLCTSAASAAVLLGFSGLSVMLQVAAVCGGRLSVMPFIACSAAKSAFMGVTAYFLFDYTK